MSENNPYLFYESAKEDLLYIFNTYVKVYFNKDVKVSVKPVNYEIKEVDVIEEVSLIEYKIYPSKVTPVICLHLENAQISKDRKRAVKIILNEIFMVSEYGYNNPSIYPRYEYTKNRQKKLDALEEPGKLDRAGLHRHNRYDFAYELGIAIWLGTASADTMYNVINELAKWGVKTYEGQQVPYGVLIDLMNNEKNGIINFVEFMRTEKSGAVFTDGVNSFVKLNAHGEVLEYFSVGTSKTDIPSFTPSSFEKFADKCTSNDDVSNIGIILMENGTILIIKKQKLILARRNGRWYFVDSDFILDKLYHFIELDREIRKVKEDKEDISNLSTSLLLSLLDVSYIGHGGCIAIVKDEYIDHIKTNYCKNDRLDNKSKILKHIFIKHLIKHPENLKFQELDRNLLLDFLSIDGALVIDTLGNLISIGAIVKVPGGSNEGGRTAATKEMARYGIGMKISEDGKISIYKQGLDPDSNVKLIFESE